MATECTQEAVLHFLIEQGGRVKNLELIYYFKTIFPEEPGQKAIFREKFKVYVDNVAFVKLENGVKYVCLKKKYQHLLSCTEKSRNDNGSGVFDTSTTVVSKSFKYLIEDNAQANLPECCARNVYSCETIANEKKKQEMSINSGFETDNASGARRTGISGIILTDTGRDEAPPTSCVHSNNSLTDNVGNVFKEPILTTQEVQTLQQSHSTPRDCTVDQSFDGEHDSSGIMSQVRSCQLINSHSSSESQHMSSEDRADEVHYSDLQVSVCCVDSLTPDGSHEKFTGLMLNSSQQVRRSRVLRNSVCMSEKYRDCARNDSDAISLVSSTTDEDGGLVTLDPLEHEWMMCASDGHWKSLNPLLSCEPNLIMKKDFVTGYTCLHWAAKQGKQELLALFMNFAQQHMVAVDINTRSSAGYTPLHLAAMHNHIEVVKLLVGAYNADIEARDYSGKKACQYLKNGVSLDIRDIIGAGCDDFDPDNTDQVDGGRWRLSKVLQSNLPLKLLSHIEEDTGDGAGQARQKPVSRKSSLSKMKPKLQKIRLRSSQIVHSASFTSHCEAEELDGSKKSSFKSRPMSSLFG